MSLVSVIIPYFNKKEFIFNCINSILKQTYKNFEIIIVNDECSDDSRLILKEIANKDSRIRVVNNKNNLGPGLSRNIGIKKSNGEFLAFIDADDEWLRNKLKSQVHFMKTKKILFTHMSYFIINNQDKLIGKFSVKKFIRYKDLINSCDIGLSTVMVSSRIKKEMHFCSLKTKEDYVLWLKLSKKYTLYGINRFNTKWRNLSSSISSSIYRRIIDAFFVYYFFEKFSFIKSIFLVLNLSLFSIKKKYNQYIIK
jgi:teichuronic acid biosynthesis glycosyltransferase TuaG